MALLSGPAIDGVVPSGKAEFAANQGATTLDIIASNLNLPGRTTLTVSFGRFVLKDAMPVFGGSAFLSLNNLSLEAHPGELITISVGDGGVIILGQAPAPSTIILSGTFQ